MNTHKRTIAHHEEFGREIERAREDRTLLGFWIYIMSDCLLFASLFATYAILHNNTWGGPGGEDLFSLPFVLAETLILLTSSFTMGLATVFARHEKKEKTVIALLGITLLLGLSFLTLELSEFSRLAAEGNSWQKSGFLSAFFTLVGTHGFHVAMGSIWMIVMMIQAWGRGLSATVRRRLFMLAMFWHFLDVIWIFIFTIVYLMGII